MRDTQKVRQLLERAFNEISDKSTYSDVCSYIRGAISQLDYAERKVAKRQNNSMPQNSSQWEFDIKQGLLNPYTPKGTLDKIEAMINDEKKKLDEIENSKTKNDIILG